MLIARNTDRTPANVSSSWTRLERWIKKHLPPKLHGLHAGASEAQISALERALGQRLPDDVRESWRLHNGQGDWNAGGVIYGCALGTLKEIERKWQTWVSLIPDQEANPDDFYLDGYTSTAEDAIQRLYVSRGWIPLHDRDSLDFGVDLNPGPRGRVGQVINFGRHFSNLYVLAPSWAHFLEDIADELEAGNFILEFAGDGTIERFCPKDPDCPNDDFVNGYDHWSAAKVPDVYGGPILEPALTPAPAKEWAAAARWTQEFLSALYHWELHWLEHRPLEPLGLIRLEERRGRLEQVFFDPAKGPMHSGPPESIFGDPRLSDVSAMIPDVRLEEMRQIESPDAPPGIWDMFADALAKVRVQFQGLPAALASHPLAEIYRDPAAARRFFQDGKIYDAALQSKREIFARFAPALAVSDLFVQTDPPTYAPDANRIDDVLMSSPGNFVVTLKPTDLRGQPLSEDDSSIDEDGDAVVIHQRQIRFRLVHQDGAWAILSREMSSNGGEFHAYTI